MTAQGFDLNAYAEEIVLHRDEEPTLIAEASSVGFPVGLWPDPVLLEGESWGIAQVLYSRDREDMVAVEYRSESGRLLRVFND